MAVNNAIHRQNVFQNLSVAFLGDVNTKNWCTFELLMVHRQNLKIVLSELSRQPTSSTEHFDTNCRTKCPRCRSALLRLSIGALCALLQRVAFVALDALVDTLHAASLSFFDMSGIGTPMGKVVIVANSHLL